MCKLIAEIVGTDRRIMSEMFLRLERHCGEPGIDVRLTGEIYGALHMKMRELGLDPNDTTPHELYLSLKNLASLHDKFLANRLGIEKSDNFKEVSEIITKTIHKMRIPKSTWAIKPMTARNLLKSNPPKSLMKLLNYRSQESMIKRESPLTLLSIARFSESSAWQQRIIKAYKKLKPSDFEVRDIDVINLVEDRWAEVSRQFIGRQHNNVIHSPETGLICVIPADITRPNGLTLVCMLLILHYINEIRSFSTFSKFHHMNSDFGNIFVEHVLQNKANHVVMAGQPVHWRVIHHYFGSQDRSNHPEIFEPHIQPEDFAYRKAEAILFKLEPALNFWKNCDYVGLAHSIKPISFNLMDMAINLVNDLDFDNRVNYHLPDAMWNEIYLRYADQETLRGSIIQQLDASTITQQTSAHDMEFVW